MQTIHIILGSIIAVLLIGWIVTWYQLNKTKNSSEYLIGEDLVLGLKDKGYSFLFDGTELTGIDKKLRQDVIIQAVFTGIKSIPNA